MQRYTQEPAAGRPQKKKKKASARSKSGILRLSVAVGIALLLLIPTYFAIGSYIYVKNAPKDNVETYYTAITVAGAGGSSATVSPDADSELFQCFIGMLSSPNPVSTVKPGHTAQYSVTYHTNTGNEHYTFYFSPTDTNVYFMDDGGEIFHVTNGNGELFLNSPHAFEAYPQAILPSLQAASTDIILPVEVNWHYRTLDGDFLQLTNAATEPAVKTYGIADNFVSFMLKNPQTALPFIPDDCHLTITRDGIALFDRAIDVGDLSAPLDLPALLGNELFTIRAEYNQKSDVDYYGSLLYRFTMSTTEPAVFEIAERQAAAGGFYLFSARNVERMDQLLFSVASAPISPIVFKRGDVVYALIPTALLGNERALTVKYGSKNESFPLTVRDADETDVTTALQAIPPALDALIAEKGASPSAIDGTFTPVGRFSSCGGTLRLPFGANVTEDGEKHPLPFELYGDVDNVTAIAFGTVREVGELTGLGKYVIVDHGCGIYSWYFGLSQLVVSQGDYISVGQRLGKAGTLSFYEESNTALLMTTVGKIAVDPAFLRDFDFNLGQ